MSICGTFSALMWPHVWDDCWRSVHEMPETVFLLWVYVPCVQTVTCISTFCKSYPQKSTQRSRRLIHISTQPQRMWALHWCILLQSTSRSLSQPFHCRSLSNFTLRVTRSWFLHSGTLIQQRPKAGVKFLEGQPAPSPPAGSLWSAELPRGVAEPQPPNDFPIF